MRWVSLGSHPLNKVLAHHILDERGRVLLAKGVTLTHSLIERLKKVGIASVCIEDAATEDLNRDTLSIAAATRQTALESAYTLLTELAGGSHGKLVRPARIRQRLQPVLSEVIAQLREMGSASDHFGAVYLLDGELYHHSVNVTFYALAVGLHMGLSESQLLDLGVGTLLHDVGKLRIPEGILRKPGKLTQEEFEYIKLHTSYGYELLHAVPDLDRSSALISLEHHERVDGTGYPRGLTGEEIHSYGRITAVVDVYEALTANRIYRDAYLPHQAYELLLGGGGTQFDPDVVRTFSACIAVYPVGMTVHLTTGYKGVVVRSVRHQSHRPVVRILEDIGGHRVATPWELDLSKELTVQIVGCES